MLFDAAQSADYDLVSILEMEQCVWRAGVVEQGCVTEETQCEHLVVEQERVAHAEAIHKH